MNRAVVIKEYELQPGTVPSYVLLQKGLRVCRELVPFVWAQSSEGRLFIRLGSGGLLDSRSFLSSFPSGSLDAFRALLLLLSRICASVIKLRDLFITEEMLRIRPEQVFVERRPGNRRSLDARLALGSGGPLHLQLLDFLEAAEISVPGCNAALVEKRLKESLSLRSMTPEDLFAFFSLWLLQL